VCCFFELEELIGIVELRLESVERAEFGAKGVVPTLDSIGDGGERMIHCDDRFSDDDDCSSRRRHFEHHVVLDVVIDSSMELKSNERAMQLAAGSGSWDHGRWGCVFIV